MRKLQCVEWPCMSVHEALDDFNLHMADIGIQENDIVTINVLSPTNPQKIPVRGGSLLDARFEVVIVYWIDE